MAAQDFVQQNATVKDIRYALTVGKAERKALCEANSAIKRAVIALGNGGDICGQCSHFRPLGNTPGLNGTCKVVVKHRFTIPEEPACDFFEKREDLIQ